VGPPVASSAAADRLTRSHQVSQARKAAELLVLAMRFWRSSMRVDNIDLGVRSWLGSTIAAVLEYRRRSADMAAAYYQAFRVLETRDLVAVPPIVLAREISAEQLRTSLVVTGVASFKEAMRKQPLTPEQQQEALDVAGRRQAAAAIRHALNGGRETIDRTVQQDRRALGYARVTRETPCYFCAMLASRGPVFKASSFDESDPRFVGIGDVKVHDSCSCALEPWFSEGAEWPGRAREFDQLWGSSTKGKSGNEAVKAFRKAYEGR
jgi:hypothetical protein